ncbi:hypothetical protein ACH3XW_0230 [Acanthocheilonema viteae]
MLFLILLFVTANVSLAYRAPNGTESNFVWISCSDRPIIFHDIKLTDKNFSGFRQQILVSNTIIWNHPSNYTNEVDGSAATGIEFQLLECLITW